MTTNAAAHKESNAKKKERAKGKPETHNSTHSHTCTYRQTSHGTHTATNAMHTVPLTQFPDSFSFTPREPHEEAAATATAALAVAVAVTVAATTDLKC